MGIIDKPKSPPIPLGKVFILVMLGAALWFIGLILLRWAGSVGALSGGWQLVFYAIIIPITIPLIPLGPALARLPRHQTLRSTAILCMTALIIDGVVIGYFPELYSSDPATARAAAGCLLWGVGIALVLGLRVEDHPG